MIQTASLPLHVQKAVLARMLVYRALDFYHAEIVAAGYGVLWADVRARLDTSTTRVLEFVDDSESLPEYFVELAGQLRAAMLPWPDAAAESACTPLLAEIDRLLTDAGNTERDLLHDAFAEARRVAAEEYGRHSLPVPPVLREQISVTFDHQATALADILPIQLTASTVLDGRANGQSAQVSVMINPRLMDERTVFAVPYVLLHECLCHALQGPWVGERVQADADSRFAEGWMDVAAYLVHEAITASAGMHIDLLTAPRPDAQREAARDTHRARHAERRDDRAWSHRAMGQRAASAMHRLFASLPETEADPVTPFIRLSLALNASSINIRERDLFVTAVYKATLRESARHRLVTLLRDYLACWDIHRMVAKMTKLVT